MSHRKGKHWEYRAVEMLEEDGYLCTVAGGSLGVFDIIAIGGADVRCVQVKGGKTPRCSPKERQAILDVPVPPGGIVTKELWFFCSKRVRVPGVKVPVTAPPRIMYL